MDDPLIAAAASLGIATRTSAGPGHGPAGAAKSPRCARPRMDIAHDALDEIVERDRTAGVVPAGHSNLWRAYAAGWSHEGEFVEAVACLALHVSAAKQPRQAARSARSRVKAASR